ncbi:MAG: hypothetical protein KBS41_03110 [Oscillospiraceae bacterium]|nr:hypothetical protein [Candidatus Equicaccousia limihippi]
MKKAISLILALAVCFTMAGVVSAHEDDVSGSDVTLNIPAVEGYPGYDVEVDIEITENSGFNTLAFSVAWDPEYLTFKGFKNKYNNLPENYVNTYIDTDAETANDNGYARVGWMPKATASQVEPDDITYEGKIVTAVFTVSEDLQIEEVTTIWLEEIKCFDAELEDLDAGEEYYGDITGVEKTFEPGDLDDDGFVTDADAVYLLMNTFFPEQYEVNQPCDFDGDGFITDADAVYLLMYTFFPEQYPIVK